MEMTTMPTGPGADVDEVAGALISMEAIWRAGNTHG